MMNIFMALGNLLIFLVLATLSFWVGEKIKDKVWVMLWGFISLGLSSFISDAIFPFHF